MSRLFILFEHASGYALFRAAESEEDPSFAQRVQNSVLDVSSFQSNVELATFQPFVDVEHALENMNSVSEGILPSHLQQFLENNLPKSKKKHPVTLGVAESKLGAVITEALNITCSASDVVHEIIRGIRLHFQKLVKGVTELNLEHTVQLGLGHSYSRARVMFNVNKIDNMIIQSISLIDQLDKDINTFSMRIREWYSHHFPELIRVVPENHLYIKCVNAIRDTKKMPEDIEEQLDNILMDSAKTKQVMEAARTSMGMEISALDMENVTQFAERIQSLMLRRKESMEYLRVKMQNVAPNLATLIGDPVGARLIAHAGSLTNLAKFPASTVQILGAEKALFRALKSRGNTPKYGLIYHSTFIGRAAKTNKGRISRYLANKCSVASRIDCFRDIPTNVFGTKLRQQVEDRLKFYETGDIPDKNVDVMTVAVDEAEVVAATLAKEKRKSDKKEKKRRSMKIHDIIQNSLIFAQGNQVEAEEFNSEKKMKKRKRESMENAEAGEYSPKKTKSTNEMNNESLSDEDANAAEIAKQKRKEEKRERKRLSRQLEMSQTSFNSVGEENGETEENIVNSEKKKKKHKKHSMNITMTDVSAISQDDAEFNNSVENEHDTSVELQKKKKKKKKSLGQEMQDTNASRLSQEEELNNSVQNYHDTSVELQKKKRWKKKKSLGQEMQDADGFSQEEELNNSVQNNHDTSVELQKKKRWKKKNSFGQGMQDADTSGFSPKGELNNSMQNEHDTSVEKKKRWKKKKKSFGQGVGDM